ncbi:hypothetical protein Q763_04345 [Flavobacterium beibuense F44-8]|uniref:Uncharacterized protein n=1 Tax=Flavobacterium beibuense F44-8 TaxID=1406840 RepID=A0A0A2M4K3_9FLAO|nr:hypothetical protein [Flavobacterium beibuense]KGO83245.1 hypothetical protein Q763_04345 [Flavobacterium beibuense F44-8]
MPLSLGLRDEDNERINNQLKKLISLVFVPDGWSDDDADAQLEGIGLSLEKLKTITPEALNNHLTEAGTDWQNMELFADFLAKLSENENYSELKQKAVSLYSYIQSGSKVFSFDIANKISRLK